MVQDDAHVFGSEGLVDEVMVLRFYQRASKATPLTVAFCTCYVKGSASDAVAQVVVEGRQEYAQFNFKRNFAFAVLW